VPTVNPVGKDDENITGEGTKGSTITVVDDKGQPIEGKDGQPIATTVDDGGKWEIPVDKLPDDKKPTDVYVNQTEDGKDPSDPVKV
ncbi:Ig-like domain-containing protein, partial [Peptoniphilus sp. SGI.035]